MNPRRAIAAALVIGGSYYVLRSRTNVFLGLPLPRGSWRLTSPYGPRIHPITGLDSFHDGVDLAAQSGTEVYAVDAGKVTQSSTTGSGGNQIGIRTKSGGKTWYYLHLSAKNVKYGDDVKQGDLVGWVGSTGSSTGPHLHLQVEDSRGETLDPLKLIPRLKVA